MVYFKHSNTKIQRRTQASKDRVAMISMKAEIGNNKKLLLFIGLILVLLTLQVALFGIFGTRGTELARILNQQKATNEDIAELEGDLARLRAVNTITEKNQKLNLIQARSVVEVDGSSPETIQLASNN